VKIHRIETSQYRHLYRSSRRKYKMKRFSLSIGAAVLACLMAACNQPADGHDADVQTIKDNEAQWNQDWQAKAVDKIAAHYADDAVLMAPGTPATSGKDAIAGALKQMLYDPAASLKFHASKVEVAKSGDLAYTQGSYTMSMTNPQTKETMNDHGSYVTVYRKEADGTWKAVSDIATSEVPPPAPVPASKKH
jgi:uncharacterized protein (TIGR02246 family)